MKHVQQFSIILLISVIGELLKTFLPLPVPASVYGLIIMLVALLTGILKLDQVKGAADTYDVLYAMQLAADDAKITPDMENADISAAMSASMANIELDGLTGKAKWTEDGECDKEPKAFEIKDGAYVEMK